MEPLHLLISSKVFGEVMQMAGLEMKFDAHVSTNILKTAEQIRQNLFVVKNFSISQKRFNSFRKSTPRRKSFFIHGSLVAIVIY